MFKGYSVIWQKIARRIRVPAGFVFTVLYLGLARPTWKSILLGTVFVVVGIVIRALASGHLEKNEQLATTGPYAYTRNPLYLGSSILALGFAAAALSWWIAIGLAMIFAAIYLPVIQAEETFLQTRFPEFSEYARKVPRIFPRVTNFNHADGGFSWSLYLKHHEYNAALGSASLMAALTVKLLWSFHSTGTRNSIF